MDTNLRMQTAALVVITGSFYVDGNVIREASGEPFFLERRGSAIYLSTDDDLNGSVGVRSNNK
ncbi:MAG: hypothetical protein IE909_10675 [Campylobacterales bacterium]|nr:hypothetical protein [Campylobacterales bacterium]